MTTTYDQFVKRFQNQLREVAEFDGEETTTMEVIIDSLNQSGLKEICDGIDQLRGGGLPTDEVVDKKVKKTTAASKKASDKTGDEKPRGKRVTAYNIYVAEQVKEKKTTMKEAAASWKTMNDEAKASYIVKAKQSNSAE